MPTYDIRYMNRDGTVAARFFAHCSGDDEAKALMRAIQMEGVRQVSVWHGNRLIYTGLHNFAIPADPVAADAQARAAAFSPEAGEDVGNQFVKLAVT